MTAYYNEFDPYAAEWLKNLISAGHIAPGDVDSRSITEVTPDDVKGYTQAHFFTGIGGWSLAARLAGWPDTRELWTGSCPCQPFSSAGNQKGEKDERHLWPVWFQLIAACTPPSLWESKLRQRLEKIGSMECLLTWKDRVTPAGRRYCQLVPSMRPTVEIDCGLWRTPTAQGLGQDTAASARGKSVNLAGQAEAAMWPTPKASDGEKGNRTFEGTVKEISRGKGPDLPCMAVNLALWTTPSATDGIRGGTMTEAMTGSSLPQQVNSVPAMWPTPMAHEARLGYQHRHAAAKGTQKSLTTEAVDSLGLGSNVNGSSATMEKRGALNPEFVCWLMGFPPEWVNCAPLAMPSSRKSRQK